MCVVTDNAGTGIKTNLKHTYIHSYIRVQAADVQNGNFAKFGTKIALPYWVSSSHLSPLSREMFKTSVRVMGMVK